ncbi:hypothetical protein PAPYR_1974 [Paratrimastix pyriformis]|uniref:N-acetyltransferase domain-containing protein n=1 Tax=Paratrimastix pyriformis TaxID=342808 RepID=A0ABQ8URD7_9EUKA|nr:hypothetical protein PAPYR_1974 [Paratrimastix pyriformis]
MSIVPYNDALHRQSLMALCSLIWNGGDYIPRFIDYWKDTPRCHPFVLESEDDQHTVICFGCITMHTPGYAWLNGLRTHPKYGKHYYGQKMMTYMLQYAREVLHAQWYAYDTHCQRLPVLKISQRLGIGVGPLRLGTFPGNVFGDAFYQNHPGVTSILQYICGHLPDPARALALAARWRLVRADPATSGPGEDGLTTTMAALTGRVLPPINASFGLTGPEAGALMPVEWRVVPAGCPEVAQLVAAGRVWLLEEPEGLLGVAVLAPSTEGTGWVCALHTRRAEAVDSFVALAAALLGPAPCPLPPTLPPEPHFAYLQPTYPTMQACPGEPPASGPVPGPAGVPPCTYPTWALDATDVYFVLMQGPPGAS